MSYSFSIKAPTKADAKTAVEAAYDAMVASQPIHARDRAAALAAANSMIDLLVDDPSMHVAVSVNGYVSWRDVLAGDASNPLVGASVGTSATLVVPG